MERVSEGDRTWLLVDDRRDEEEASEGQRLEEGEPWDIGGEGSTKLVEVWPQGERSPLEE